MSVRTSVAGKPNRIARKKSKSNTPVTKPGVEKPATKQVLHWFNVCLYASKQGAFFIVGILAIVVVSGVLFGNLFSPYDAESVVSPKSNAVGDTVQSQALLGLVSSAVHVTHYVKLALSPFFFNLGDGINVKHLHQDAELAKLKTLEEKQMKYRADQLEHSTKSPDGIRNMLNRRQSKIVNTLIHSWNEAAWAFD